MAALRRAHFVLVLAACLVCAVSAQRTFRSGVDVVHFGVTVVDRKGTPITGLTASDFEIYEDRLTGVSISGDFFCYPPEGIRRLETELEGRPIAEIRELIEDLYARGAMDIPGVGVEDWLSVFAG